MLTQFKIIPKILYLQHFENPESKDYFHRHRWHYMRSLVLSGEYTEERPGGIKITHRAGQSFAMDHSTVHRVDTWGKDCWTIFLMLKPDEDWGWYRRIGNGDLGEFTHWRAFLKARVPSLDTGKIT